MRIPANENFPGDAVAALREQGHDVAWVRADAPGISDRDVLARAQAEDRIVITFDKDFGELAFRHGLPASSGIILFRIPPRSPQFVARFAVRALEAQADWKGHFSVVEESRIRMTPLPDVPSPSED
jgi:predicted nuclease of predicted toxin-antitoxin system